MLQWADVRLALRWFRRAPAATAIAVSSIALSAGAVAAVFTAVRAVLIEPLPYARPDELVLIRTGIRDARESEGDWVFRDDAREILRRTRTFALAGVWGNEVFDLAGDGGAPPEALYGLKVTAGVMRTLGVAPMLGRAILPEDEAAGSTEIVLSYGLWRRRFGGDRRAVGRSVTVNGHDCRIIGVMGPEFNFPLRRQAAHTPYPYVEFWAPMELDKQGPGGGMGMVGRLKPGVRLQQAQQDLASISAGLAHEFPAADRDRIFRAGPLRDRTLGQAGQALWLLMGAAALFLLIGCANVTNLLLARGLAREREMAVRMALGAGRWHIARQLLTEALVLALAGGTAGFGLAAAAWRVLPKVAPAAIPRLAAARADGLVLAAALAAAVLNGLLFGTIPAWRAGRAGLLPVRGAAAGRRDRVRTALIAAEVAITVALVVTGGRLLGSFLALLRTDPGFAADHVVTAIVPLTVERHPSIEERSTLFQQFMNAVRAIPGVASVGATDALPFSGENHGGFVTASDAAMESREQLDAEIDLVSGAYLQAMGARLIEGRWFHAEEEDAGGVAIVDEIAARRLWPGDSAIGRRVCVWCTPEKPDDWKRVVGVVTSMRHWSMEGPPQPSVYLAGHGRVFLVARTNRPAGETEQAIRKAVASVDPQQAVLLSVDLRTLVGDSLAARRFLMLLLAATGGLALALAAAGVYGVTAFATSRRTQEIGIRMALGATPRSVHALVFRQGFAAVAAGLAIGLAATAAAERALRGRIPGLAGAGAGDVWIAASVVVATTALACWAPARRAMRVEPVQALRVE